MVEHIFTCLIALVIAFSIWNLGLKILFSFLTENFDPTDCAVFEAVSGMRSLLVLEERHKSVIQARAVVMITLLAVVRKIIILDLKVTARFKQSQQ